MPETQRSLRSGSERPLGVGDAAPGFALRRTFEERVSLEDLLNGSPVLVAFYVFDFGHV